MSLTLPSHEYRESIPDQQDGAVATTSVFLGEDTVALVADPELETTVSGMLPASPQRDHREPVADSVAQPSAAKAQLTPLDHNFAVPLSDLELQATLCVRTFVRRGNGTLAGRYRGWLTNESLFVHKRDPLTVARVLCMGQAREGVRQIRAMLEQLLQKPSNAYLTVSRIRSMVETAFDVNPLLADLETYYHKQGLLGNGQQS